MKNKILKLLVVITVITFTACDSDFLDIEPKGKLASENYPSTNAEAEMAIVGVYDLMQWNYGRPWHSAFFIKVLSGDGSNAGGSNSSDQAQLQQIDDFTHVSDNVSIDGIWEGFYKTISLANTIIEVLPEKDFSSKEQIIAEAKFLRAYNYFELITLFGDVPLILVSAKNESEYNNPRIPKEEVYAQIEGDLTDAIEILPLKSALSSGDKYRASKGTAQALLGKVHLFQEEWTEAASMFDVVISSGEYDLEENFADIWSSERKLGGESLFELLYSSGRGYDWGNFPWDGTSESNIHVQLMGPREMFDVSAIGISNGWGFNIPTAKIGQAFIDEEDNVRMAASLISEADLIAAGGAVNEENIHDYEGYIRLKYVTKTSETSSTTGATPDLNYETSWKLLRYADVLLMAAEAYYRSGDEVKALTELNKVRARANLADIESSGSALFEDIVKERQLELAFEGQRYWDLVRWGLASEELSSLGFESGKHEVLPIPQSEINSNTEIPESDQNPGF